MKLVKNIKQSIIGLLSGALLSGCSSTKSFMDVAVYDDTREMFTSTLTAGASNLPFETNMYSFLDIETEKQNNSNLKSLYGEIRLSKKSDSGLGIAIEYNQDFALSKGVIRQGAIFEPNLKKIDESLFLGVKYFPASTDNHGSQLGLYGKKDFNNGDFYIGGYWDYNFKPDKIVTDIQFGKRIKDNLYFVVEGRYNSFKNKNKKGIGIGLEYKFK